MSTDSDNKDKLSESEDKQKEMSELGRLLNKLISNNDDNEET